VEEENGHAEQKPVLPKSVCDQPFKSSCSKLIPSGDRHLAVVNPKMLPETLNFP